MILRSRYEIQRDLYIYLPARASEISDIFDIDIEEARWLCSHVAKDCHSVFNLDPRGYVRDGPNWRKLETLEESRRRRLLPLLYDPRCRRELERLQLQKAAGVL